MFIKANYDLAMNLILLLKLFLKMNMLPDNMDYIDNFSPILVLSYNQGKNLTIFNNFFMILLIIYYKL